MAKGRDHPNDEQDAPIAGYGALGSMLYSRGYYYGHVYRSYHENTGAGPPNTTGAGICQWRTSDLHDPSAYRLWNGTGFDVEVVNPYTVPPIKPEDLVKYTCKELDLGFRTSHVNPKRIADSWRPSGFPSHVLLAWPEGGAPNQVAYSFLPDGALDSPAPFTSWSAAQYVSFDGWADPHTVGGLGSYMYPTLIDHDSPFGLSQSQSEQDHADGLSYGLLGNGSMYVYMVYRRAYIVRYPVAWLKAGQPAPQPPFPPKPSIPTTCQSVQVAGAGLTSVNGIYHKQNDIYEMDSTHQIYCFGNPCRWEMAHRGHPPVYYEGPAPHKNTTMPGQGWEQVGAPAPFPTVECID